MAPPPLKSTESPPPRINVGSTCTLPRTPIQNNELSVDSTVDSLLASPPPPARPSANISRSPSPAMSVNGRKSPYQIPTRSATPPLPVPPLSPLPDLSISQDSAFPRFPTARSRCVTPTTPLESSFPSSQYGQPPPRTEKDSAYTPTSQVDKGGKGVQCGGGIAAEPSDSGARGYAHKSRHRRSNSMSNSRDFSRPTSSGTSHTHQTRPSTSSSNYTRRPSMSSTSGSIRFPFERSKTDVPALPAVPPPEKQHEDTKSAGHILSDSVFDFGSFGQDHRSQTFPTDNDRSKMSEDQTSMHRRPSEPSIHSHKPRPSVAAAVMQPLNSIGSTSSFKPSKSIRGRNAAPPLDRTASSSKGAKDEKRLENAPPVPMHTKGQSFESETSHHTPHESTSSNESYSSGRRTGSSRSSPPLHDSVDDTRIDNLFKSFQFDVDRQTTPEPPPAIKESTPTGYVDSRPSKPKALDSPMVQTLSPYEADDYLVPSFNPLPERPPLSPRLPTLSPAPTSDTSGQRRPTTAHKGNCRGCGEVIKGKSVRAEDGRLTGRYHKQCFVCKTCKAPFPTADFYVMENHPYCARHYHELNESLCKNCDRGIEGPYLETEQKQKFHPHCFSCQECHRILKKDYFEFDGRTLCEQHAHRAAQQPSSLGPGRRFPERRTTRLMMM